MGLGGRKKRREGGKRKSQIRAWEEVRPAGFYSCYLHTKEFAQKRQ